MNIQINEKPVQNKIPQQGELWRIKRPELPGHIILVVQVDSRLFNYISLEDANRWSSPKSLEGLYDELVRNGYAITKFDGSITISNK